MPIQNDALRVLAVLYNHKIKGIDEVRSDNPEILKLELSKIEFKNALEHLKGKKYEYERKINHMTILTKGIDLMENDKKFKSSFGNTFTKQTASDKSIIIIDNSTNISNPRINNVKHENTGDINYGNITHNTVTQDNSN